MARRKVAIYFYVDPDELEGLRAINQQTGLPQSHFVREGLRRVLANPKGARRRDGEAVGRKMTTLSSYIEPEQADRLKALSAESRVPKSCFIRDGIGLVLGLPENQQR